jgi:Tol biopolymer transport system component
MYDRLSKTTTQWSVEDDGYFTEHAFSFSRNHRYLASSLHNRIWIRDVETGVRTRISDAPGGDNANSFCGNPIVSKDGRFVAFTSNATNLSAKDQNVINDVYMRFLPGAAKSP